MRDEASILREDALRRHTRGHAESRTTFHRSLKALEVILKQEREEEPPTRSAGRRRARTPEGRRNRPSRRRLRPRARPRRLYQTNRTTAAVTAEEATLAGPPAETSATATRPEEPAPSSGAAEALPNEPDDSPQVAVAAGTSLDRRIEEPAPSAGPADAAAARAAEVLPNEPDDSPQLAATARASLDRTIASRGASEPAGAGGPPRPSRASDGPGPAPASPFRSTVGSGRDGDDAAVLQAALEDARGRGRRRASVDGRRLM